MNRGDKLYLNGNRTKESAVNPYLDCRDGIVEMLEYTDDSGYGSPTKLFLCQNSKHEQTCIVRQTFSNLSGEWMEEAMRFDSDSFAFLRALLNGDKNVGGGKYTLLRDYNLENESL
jgi:hypothetical protein